MKYEFYERHFLLIMIFTIICAIVLSLLFFSQLAYAQGVNQPKEVGFAWYANTEADLAGYYLYWSDTTGGHVFGKDNAVATIPKGTETVRVQGHEAGYWVLTAYDKNGFESGPSNELETFAPDAPKGFLFNFSFSFSQ